MTPSSTVNDFIRTIINKDIAAGIHDRIIVRFPPEPNGYLHIGHAKSSTLNFGLAAEYGGQCHLRFDDTNPATEDQKYVDAIKRDLKWLGFDWGEHEYYTSDYFETLFKWACQLIQKGLAYVDDSSENVIRSMRGTVTSTGTHSPYRDRSPEENMERFEAMRLGKFEEGACVLRAKIDMDHPNMKMRDPLMYRIRHATHYRRGDRWCIYPFYDWAHGQSDAIEGVTHSICTLEFATNRVLYDWYLDALEIDPCPRQYEFARLNLEYSLTSKRKLLDLVQEHVVDGWSDPRMPTLAGLRRRGIRPEAIHTFCESVGTTRVDSSYDPAALEHCIRDDLNELAPRVHCVQDPLPVTLTNWPDDRKDIIEAPYWPHDIPREGTRPVPFSKEILIEKNDFSENPPKGFRRLTLGGIVRLRHAYIIRCTDFKKNENGQIVHLYCECIEGTLSGTESSKSSELRPQCTIHWVDAKQSLPVTVREYHHLLSEPTLEGELWEGLNPSSLLEHSHAYIEPSVADDPPDRRYQFVRLGYYWRDPKYIGEFQPVFNCIVPLRDSATKGKKKPQQASSEKNKSKGTQRPLTPEERQWLQRSGLNAATGLAIYQVPDAPKFFEIASESAPPASVGNWMANQLLPSLKDLSLSDLPFGPNEFSQLVQLVDCGVANSHETREVLKLMFTSTESPTELLIHVQDSIISDPEALKMMIVDVLDEYSDRVQAYADGKVGLLGFFVGQIMKRTHGKVNPKQVQSLVTEELSRLTS